MTYLEVDSAVGIKQNSPLNISDDIFRGRFCFGKQLKIIHVFTQDKNIQYIAQIDDFQPLSMY
jgi:hypothetical protein